MQDGQAWDKTSALARMANNESLLEKVVGMFLETAPGIIGQLHSAIQAENFTEINAQAHSLKGAAGNIGAEQVANLCAAIEQAAKAEDSAQIQQHWSSFPDAYSDLLQAVDHMS